MMSLKQRREATSKHVGDAFIVESMVLMAFLIASLAVFVTLFSQSHTIADNSTEQSQAINAARSCAEAFAADPASAPAVQTVGDLTVSCTTSATTNVAGTLYRAVIRVANKQGVQVYALDTARYVGGAK